MANITIELTSTELKALEYVAVSPEEWSENVLKFRASQAIDKIVSLVVAHCNENSIALAVGRDAQVTQAYDLGIVDTAANIQAAMEAEQS
jgi:hypothetical protein